MTFNADIERAVALGAGVSAQFELGLGPPKVSRSSLTVTEVTAKVKGLIEKDIGEVWVRGEISGFKPSAAGHLYYSLKDAGAVLNCAMFRVAGKLKFQLEDGLEVIAHGRMSVYAPRGAYQLVVDHVEPVGAGALQLAFEQLKAKLLKEGLFEQGRKRALPPYPRKIAIVTSPTGAALQDMLTVLGRRNAGISILVVPALVQGEAAAGQLTRALEVVNHYDLAEVVVLARGGGSLEDLWAFNDEMLVRAVAASRIPVISAVGHEVDFTLCDFAADLRAPTPSAAAELVSRNRLEVIEALLASEKRLALTFSGHLARARASLLALEARLTSPSQRLTRLRNGVVELELRLGHAVESSLATLRQLADELALKLGHAASRVVLERRRSLETLAGRLEALSPLKVLGRGYTLVQDPATGTLVKSVRDTAAGRNVALVFHDGKADARIL